MNYENINFFIDHNNVFFKSKNKNIQNLKKEILVEFNRWAVRTVINSYVANSLSKKYNAVIKSYPGYECFYSQNIFQKILLKVKWKISNFLSVKTFKIYKSFGVKNFFLPVLNKSQIIESENIFKNLKKKINTKKKLLDLKIRNVYVGDLIYNSYVKIHRKIYFNFNDTDFKEFLFYSIQLFVFWYDYLNKKKVSALVIDHSVYIHSINHRIATFFKIPVYYGGNKSVFKYDKKNTHPFCDFKNYRKKFLLLKKTERKDAITIAKKRITARFKKSSLLDIIPSGYNPYSIRKIKKNIFKKSKKLKIFVAPHCFFDSPVLLGKNLFTDFIDWLEFLGKTSEKKNFDWYIKPHPSFIKDSFFVIKDFVKRYKNFNLLPVTISHNQVFNNVDVALTCHGSIGWEYPFNGVPVINASINNPHINYNFTINPRSQQKYKKIILNLDKKFLDKEKSKININEIYEYYYMNYLYKKDPWILQDFNNIKKKYLMKKFESNSSYRDGFYLSWIKNFTVKNHNMALESLENFIDSKEIDLNETRNLTPLRYFKI